METQRQFRDPRERVRQGGTAFNVFARVEISDIKDLWPFSRYC
jgi:hypothetical protein